MPYDNGLKTLYKRNGLNEITMWFWIKDEMTVDEFLNSDHGMITMVTFNLM